MGPYFNVSSGCITFDKCSIKLMSEIIAIFARNDGGKMKMPSYERWFIDFIQVGEMEKKKK